MIDFVFKMMDFVFKMMKLLLKSRNFVINDELCRFLTMLFENIAAWKPSEEEVHGFVLNHIYQIYH